MQFPVPDALVSGLAFIHCFEASHLAENFTVISDPAVMHCHVLSVVVVLCIQSMCTESCELFIDKKLFFPCSICMAGKLPTQVIHLSPCHVMSLMLVVCRVP